MSKQLELKIITPEKLILEEMVNGVTLPTTEGEITILPGHRPLIANLSSGDIVAISNDENIPIAVVGGFIEVKKTEDDRTIVAILCDFALHVSSITDDSIERAKTRAEELKKLMLARPKPLGEGGENKEAVDFEHFESELERSITQIRIAGKWKSKKYRK